MDEDVELTISRLKSELESANNEARDFEGKMMKAALYGKELLDKNLELEAELEREKQEKYETNLRFQAKCDIERSLNSELELLRENLKTEEIKLEQLRENEEEKTSKREETLTARLSETEQELDIAKANENRLKILVETLESQLAETNSALNKSVDDESFSNEVVELHQEKVQLIQDKQTLQLEVATVNSQLTGLQDQILSLKNLLEEKDNEIESVQIEISSYSKTIDNLNLQLVEVQGQLDAERNMAGGESSEKGNSLFSEVEDRRQAVEDQLSVVNSKYNAIKENYDVKVAELQKVKMHNSQLLSIAGGGSNNTEHVTRLEDMLAQEKKKVRQLMESLDQLGASTTNVKRSPHKEGTKEIGSNDGAPSRDVSLMDTNDSTVEPSDHLQSKEYKYMAHMLDEANKKQEELRDEVKRLVREGVDQSDKQQDMSRQLHNAEVSVKLLKSENYSLKMELENAKLKTDNSTAQAKKQETKKRRIVEQVNFGCHLEDGTTKENLEPADQNPGGFSLKETVVAKSSNKTGTCTTNSDTSTTNNVLTEDNINTENVVESGPKKRRGIQMSDKVEEINEDGSKAEKDLDGEANSSPAVVSRGEKRSLGAVDAAHHGEVGKKIRGAGRKHTAAEVKKGKVEQECKQQ